MRKVTFVACGENHHYVTTELNSLGFDWFEITEEEYEMFLRNYWKVIEIVQNKTSFSKNSDKYITMIEKIKTEHLTPENKDSIISILRNFVLEEQAKKEKLKAAQLKKEQAAEKKREQARKAKELKMLEELKAKYET